MEAKQIQIGCSRKRGRPRTTKPALKYQDEIEYVYSESEAQTVKPKSKSKTKTIEVHEFEEDEEEYDLYADNPQPSTSAQSLARSNLNITILKDIQKVAKNPKKIHSKEQIESSNIRNNPISIIAKPAINLFVFLIFFNRI